MLNTLALLGSVVLVPAAVSWQQLTFLIVAPIGFVVGSAICRMRAQPFATPAAWQKEHLTSLITAGITLHTVLLVFTSSRTLGDDACMVGEPRAVDVASAVGLPIIFWLRNRWRWQEAIARCPLPCLGCMRRSRASHVRRRRRAGRASASSHARPVN